MIVSIMQPYLFPYLDYFRLIANSDVHVVLDDVSFRKKGFINRNSVFNNNVRKAFNIIIKDISQNRKINEHKALSDNKDLRRLVKRSTKNNYPELSQKLDQQFENIDGALVSELLTQFNRHILTEFSINTPLFKSSELNICQGMRGKDRIKAIVKYFGATQYLNLPGGRLLYNEENFEKDGLQLKFLKTTDYTSLGLSEDQFFQSILGTFNILPKAEIHRLLTN